MIDEVGELLDVKDDLIEERDSEMWREPSRGAWIPRVRSLFVGMRFQGFELDVLDAHRPITIYLG